MEHEPRKLIKFGSSSHIISIPQKWIQSNSLKKGDMIFLTESNENELILSPKNKKIEFSCFPPPTKLIDKPEPLVKRFIS